MPKITSFDRPSTRALTDDILAAIETLCRDRGVSVKFAGGTIGGAEATIKLAFKTDAAAKDPALTVEGNAYRVMAPKSFPALGSIIRDGRTEYLIVGWNMNAPKRPVMLREVATGKDVRAPEGWVRQRITSAAAA